MSTSTCIGVVGGYGAVGRSLCRELQADRQIRLRIGGRSAVDACAPVGDNDAEIEYRRLDVQDSSLLKSFCAGCDVIVNCAGPANAVSERIGCAAFNAGAHYVDTASSNRFRLPDGPRAALISAGMYPGLTGLLPRLLAEQEFDTVSELTAFVGGCDTLSKIAAIDYLESLEDGLGTANVIWRDGIRIPERSSSGQIMSVPFFPRPVTLQPYLIPETEQLAASLGLSILRWYSVFDGEHVVSALPAAARKKDGDALVRAAELDAFGRERYQILLFEMTGMAGGRHAVRTLRLRACGGAELTGVAAACGVKAFLGNMIPRGIHEFAQVMNPGFVVEHLAHTAAVSALTIGDGPLMSMEHGEL
jgi:hypothetical protein